MSHLTTGEQAKLEHSLALAHRHIFQAQQLMQSRDAYDTADELGNVCVYLFDLLAAELNKGSSLRTRR